METLTDRVELSRQNGLLVTENEAWIREIVMAVRGTLNQWPVSEHDVMVITAIPSFRLSWRLLSYVAMAGSGEAAPSASE
jgi:hypothetical protein